jgi:hypothetical protein
MLFQESPVPDMKWKCLKKLLAGLTPTTATTTAAAGAMFFDDVL